MESEFVFMTDAVNEFIWYDRLLRGVLIEKFLLNPS